MKKSSLYFIYTMLFAILLSVAENKLVIGISAICMMLYFIASLVLSYFEDKDKYN